MGDSQFNAIHRKGLGISIRPSLLNALIDLYHDKVLSFSTFLGEDLSIWLTEYSHNNLSFEN